MFSDAVAVTQLWASAWRTPAPRGDLAGARLR